MDERVLDSFPGVRPDPRPLAEEPPALNYEMLAAALTLTVVVIAAWIILTRPQWQIFGTELGGFERVRLRDGSTALLNTNSEMKVHFTGARREITLARGEVLFNVAPDSRRPFDVTAGNTTVRAVGTSFAVRIRPRAQVEVTVSKGFVAIVARTSNTQTQSTLSAGEDALIQEGRVYIEPVDADHLEHRLAWTEGRLWFSQNSLAEAVSEFNRYNHRQLVIIDATIANLRIGGTFDATDPDAFASAVAQVFAIDVLPLTKTPSGTEIIRLAGRKSPWPSR